MVRGTREAVMDEVTNPQAEWCARLLRWEHLEGAEFDQLKSSVTRIAARHTGYDLAEAEAVASDVFLQLNKERARDSLLRSRDIVAAMRAMIYRVAITRYRREKRHHNTISFDESLQDAIKVPDNDDDDANAARIRKVAAIWEQLPPKDRELLNLRFRRRLTFRAI